MFLAERDGDAWRDLRIRDAGGKLIGNVRAWGTMVKQGFTQLFFESAEPSFDELDPADFFARFPEGEYRIDGWGNQGGRMHASSLIRHVLPAPPGGITVSGLPKAPTCDEEDPDYDAALVPTVSSGNPVIVDWAPVISSHPTIGIVGDIEVERYEFFVETDTEVGGEEFTAKLAMILPPDATEMMVPEELLGLGEQFKYEILVREREGGNQTAIESCFFLVRN